MHGCMAGYRMGCGAPAARRPPRRAVACLRKTSQCGPSGRTARQWRVRHILRPYAAAALHMRSPPPCRAARAARRPPPRLTSRPPQKCALKAMCLHFQIRSKSRNPISNSCPDVDIWTRTTRIWPGATAILRSSGFRRGGSSWQRVRRGRALTTRDGDPRCGMLGHGRAVCRC